MPRFRLPGLLTRFDGRVLRIAPTMPLAAPASTSEAAPIDELLDWCRAEPQRPFLSLNRPTNPAIDWPTTLEHLQRRLDGDLSLQALPPGWRRWALRLKVKACDTLPARWRPFDAPWDAGYLADDPDVRQALADFRPRRPTLMVAEPMSEGHLQSCVDVLRTNASAFAWPVRLILP